MAQQKQRGRGKPKPEPPPEMPQPWEDEGEDIGGPEIGTGFVRWDKPGEYIRGVITNRWQSRTMNRPAVALQVTELPNVAVEDHGEPVAVQVGDVVNVGLSAYLEKRIGPEHVDKEVGIFYEKDVPVHGQANMMRSFVVKLFELPF